MFSIWCLAAESAAQKNRRNSKIFDIKPGLVGLLGFHRILIIQKVQWNLHTGGNLKISASKIHQYVNLL